MFLAALRLRPEGEMVAIVPRSFCNGPYFKPFRTQFFSMMGLRHVHLFENRKSAFRGDDVLQENIILHAVKGAPPPKVTITTSPSANFEWGKESGECVGPTMTQRAVDYASVIRPNDPDRFVCLAANEIEQKIADRMAHFTTTLRELGLEVSTGPVVDFRLRSELHVQPKKGTAPLLYSAHFRTGSLQWPQQKKKPNAIDVTETTRKWLYANEGNFVLTRRFTAKEEKRRIVAWTYGSELPGDLIGFENHLNVFHSSRQGCSRSLAAGLCLYLNSTLVDRYFRQFNGHTQVNATDLRSLGYPNREVLDRIGNRTRDTALPQWEIDQIIEEELQRMTDKDNPLEAQQKIDEAKEIIQALGMPRGQQNDRSALTLLALLDLKPGGRWDNLRRLRLGITPIMKYCAKHYGVEYAPNTRETFRRQTMHQFVEAAIAIYNPDQPDRPVNSPKACYQISEEACDAIRTYGTDSWQGAVKTFLALQPSLKARWAKHREMQEIPVQVAEGREIRLSPGPHSELIMQIINILRSASRQGLN